MFAKKLKRLGNTVGIEVLEGLPHGFLNFSLVSIIITVIFPYCLKKKVREEVLLLVHRYPLHHVPLFTIRARYPQRVGGNLN